MTIPAVTASVPLLEPPGWAVAERQLFDLLDYAWRRFAADFAGPDGRLNYRHQLTSRDGADDFYETFFNWPQLYLLGGADDLLPQAERHWEGVTAQLSELGLLKDEYERGYDWFHQGESLLLLYFLSMAAPGRWRDRAVRFAELYVDPAHGNYDPTHRIIRRPHNGSDPDRTGLFDGTHYPWLEHEERLYGFPLDWFVFDAVKPPRAADPRLAGEMTARLGAGDTAVNLASAGLVLNAWILTGDQRYRDWIIEYVGAWRERAAANGGVIPDNVGPDGVVGSLLDGRWYGGHYGWSWPHGWYSVGQAATVGALAAAAASGDQSFLDLVRPALDTLIGEGLVKPFAESDSSIRSKWYPQLREDVAVPTFLVPFRRSDRGWFDYNPLMPAVPVALWHHSGDSADLSRLADLRKRSGYDWRTVRSFRSKEEAGHEEPWLVFLAGEHPEYPAQILAAAQAQVRHRLARGRAYRDIDIAEADIHVWQQCNPVVTEALVQLTWGGPQVIYNGGMQQARVRYYDGERQRPGLPDSVAALVSAIDPEATVVDLVNLDPEQDRTVIIQAGAFAEHTIEEVRYTACPDPSWMGGLYEYGHAEPVTAHKHAEVGGPWLTVRLPASTQVRVTIRLGLRTRIPSYATPFDGSPPSPAPPPADAVGHDAPATSVFNPAAQTADGPGVP
jgi:hypothetical protein